MARLARAEYHDLCIDLIHVSREMSRFVDRWSARLPEAEMEEFADAALALLVMKDVYLHGQVHDEEDDDHETEPAGIDWEHEADPRWLK